ncbi:uncharacterized protein LOC122278652 [Carya illinoinensis]|uniref:uncharacterized protein LOC122278652 n=1 Tax=Carya illinoinensis TaxID=32201 RepID=UPI001C71FDA7|nr:uncharacterized protein LOC122278652 [Carya illinoinensis]
MKSLSWNARGLGNPRGIRALHDLVKKEGPDIMFLQETKVSSRIMDRVKYQVGLHNCLTVDCEGRSGGLSLLWRQEVELTIKSFSKHHIDAEVKDSDNKGWWQVTGLYRHPETSRREETWDLMRSLSRGAHERWLVMGDFNEITSRMEKKGGKDRAELQMESFRRIIDDCTLIDLGSEGTSFTWWNSREGVNAIHERLDRALANNAWCRAFPYAKVFHTIAAYSDHNPIVLQTEGCVQKFKGQKPFMFEAVWTESEECAKVIEKAWQVHCGDGPIGEVVNKISRCSGRLLRWNKASFGTV